LIKKKKKKKKLLYPETAMNPVFTTSCSTIPSVKAKKFTAEEVTLIVAMLGEPPYREETLSYPP